MKTLRMMAYMKTQEIVLPTEHEIADFFQQMRHTLPNWTADESKDKAEQNPKRGEIVLDNNSRNKGIVQAIYGQLE
jgi:hypothetical protein